MRSEQMLTSAHAMKDTRGSRARKVADMDVAIDQLPDDMQALKRLVAQQQKTIAQSAQQLERSAHKIERHEQTIARERARVETKQTTIERLEEQLRRMQQHRFGRRSEKDANQGEFQWFNEAELLAAQAQVSDFDEADKFIDVPGHKRKASRSRQLPADLPRAEVIHDLSEQDKVCPCGLTMDQIGADVTEQLSIIPQQFYVIVHRRLKYGCACKSCVRTAPMPKAPLPGSQASAQLIAYSIVSKLHDGLPLYRQEKMAKRGGIELPRAKLARWHIDVGKGAQPLYNLIQDAFFDYDIAQSDETGIQVLKEAGRAPENKSSLWIRRGGPPERPVVLLDYAPSKSGETAYGLLSEFHGYLVCDAATNFNLSIKNNKLRAVFCNDHARRRFVDALKGLTQKEKIKGWVATKAIKFYKEIYKIERLAHEYSPQARHRYRQEHAVPVWDEFVGWAGQIQREGVAHASSRGALNYFLKHIEGLRRYCDDGRLPISNIKAEHVAKTVAIARKNFLFADTPAGAKSTAMNYCLIETARANGHNPYHYLSVVIAELPNAQTLEDYEALLPWSLTPEQIKQRYAALPVP